MFGALQLGLSLTRGQGGGGWSTRPGDNMTWEDGDNITWDDGDNLNWDF